MSNTIAGGIIDIEHSGDGGTSYTVVGKTQGSVSWGPNTNVAESGDHSTIHQDKKATTEAWEVSFEGKILSTLGGLQTLNLYDGSSILGSHDVEASSSEQFRVTVYEDATAKSNGNFKIQMETTDYLAILDDFNIEDEDFSTQSLTIHSRERPQVSN